MTIDEMTSTLYAQVKSTEGQLEAAKKRYELAARIKQNIAMTRRSDSSSLNRRWTDLEKSQDPVQKRLYAMNGYIGRPLIDKMFNRTMGVGEYELVSKGTDRQITAYVAEIYHQMILDPSFEYWQRNFAVKDYEYVSNLLKPTLRERIAGILGRLNFSCH